jgi:hypothetical protein
MKRCIFSLYINIDSNRFDLDEDLAKNIRTKNQLEIHYDFLRNAHQKYADALGVDYFFFEEDDQYRKYENSFESYISAYNAVNFYKIYLLYELSKTYDEVLYLDFDVIPMTNDNIFDLNFEKNGIAVRVNHEQDSSLYLSELNFKEISQKEKWFEDTNQTQSIRSPFAKYWNCRAMLIENGHDGENDVYNTGIVGAHRKHLDQLAYFDNFEEDLQFMHSLTTEEGLWPNYIQSTFGYDNETLFSYKMIQNNVLKLDLDDKWHYIMNNWSYVPNDAKLVHVINKDIEYVKKKYEKINL